MQLGGEISFLKSFVISGDRPRRGTVSLVTIGGGGGEFGDDMVEGGEMESTFETAGMG